MPANHHLNELNKLFNTRPNPRVVPQPFKTYDHISHARHDSGSNDSLGSTDSSPTSIGLTLTSEEEVVLRAFVTSKHGDLPVPAPSIQADLQRCSIMNKRSKGFIDEFKERARHADTWTDVQTHFTRRNATLPPAFSPTNTRFNPNAAPFVPRSQAQCTNGSNPHPAWFGAFCEGTKTGNPTKHRALAISLVDNRHWTVDDIGELAQHFCWKGSERLSDEPPLTAPFARAVFLRFGEVHGEVCANTFLGRLATCVLETFKSCWSSRYPQGISIAKPPPMAYLESALSLSSFVGDLFASDLLPAVSVRTCLNTLLSELVTVEHLYAIHRLILHANSKLWNGKEGVHAKQSFFAYFTQRTSCLQPNSSVVGNRIGKIEIDGWVKEVLDSINQWA